MASLSDFASPQSIPFWDPGALFSILDINGRVATAQSSGPALWSAIPRPWQALPREVSPWDVITLAGMRSSAMARVEGGRKKKWDHRKASAQNGETASDLGDDPAELHITLTIWTPEQLQDLAVLLPLIMPPSSALVSPRAVDVYHPALQLLGVSKIYVLSVEVPKPGSIKGTLETKIDCWEFYPSAAKPAQKLTQPMDQLLSAAPRNPISPAANPLAQGP